jgi:DNA mismatch repair ATPase MutS
MDYIKKEKKIVFLYKLVEGACHNSFGIEVA